MTNRALNFHSLKTLTAKEALFFFDEVLQLKDSFKKYRTFLKYYKPGQEKLVSLIFLESSTRTRFSFETAIARLGHKSISFSSKEGTSLDKGETLVDTLETLLAMQPDAFVIRYGLSKKLDDHLAQVTVPWVNAGSGVEAHPTQALLDAFTIYEKYKSFENIKLVFVGDVMHSRVAMSNLQLLSQLGVELAVCGPRALLPQSEAWKEVKAFERLTEALSWADVCMGLRIQKERHEPQTMSFLEEYKSDYCLNNQNLKSLKSDGLVLHPGPFVPFEDLDPEVLTDARCKVRAQVENGVYVRAVILANLLGMERAQ